MSTSEDKVINQDQLSYIGIYKLSTLMLGNFAPLIMAALLPGVIIGGMICVAFEENFQGGFPEEAHAMIILLTSAATAIATCLIVTIARIKRFHKDLRKFVLAKSKLDESTVALWLD